jgi:hypothetical protein
MAYISSMLDQNYTVSRFDGSLTKTQRPSAFSSDSIAGRIYRHALCAMRTNTATTKKSTPQVALGIISKRFEPLVDTIAMHAEYFDQIVINWNHPERETMFDVENAISKLQQSGVINSPVTLTYSAFRNDFSELRNKVNHYTRTPWVFHLDDDETLVPTVAENIRNIASQLYSEALTLVGMPRLNFIDGNQENSSTNLDFQFRLVQKNELWARPVHERPLTYTQKHLWWKAQRIGYLMQPCIIHNKTAQQHNESQDLYDSIKSGAGSKRH